MSSRLDAMRTVLDYAKKCHAFQNSFATTRPKELNKAFALAADAIEDASKSEKNEYGVAALARDIIYHDKNISGVSMFVEGSTADVSPETAQLLDYACVVPPKNMIVAEAHGPGFGWWVYVVAEPAVVENQYPDDLAALLSRARKAGCDWLLLDRDAIPLSALPFDW